MINKLTHEVVMSSQTRHAQPPQQDDSATGGKVTHTRVNLNMANDVVDDAVNQIGRSERAVKNHSLLRHKQSTQITHPLLP